MAMFLNGLEESPNQWSGWTLSGIAKCGHHLYLSGGGQNDLSSLTGWTTVSGSAPVVEGARFKVTAAGNITNAVDFTGAGGNFDMRMDFSIVKINAADNLVAPGFVFSDNNEAYAHIFNQNLYTSYFNPSWQDTSNTQMPAAVRYGTLRVVRTTNTFQAWYFDPFKQAWANGVSVTQSFSTTISKAGLRTQNITSGSLVYYQNMRNVVPTVTSGTATSPVMDTVDGFRGVGWFADTVGTGTVLVEYRVGATSGACSAASYQTATNWLPLTPSASSRYVQVRLTISGGSTTAPSPEVGPILVNGSLDQSTATLLFKRTATSFMRHTNSVYQVAQGEAAAQGTAYWSRVGLGGGYWVAANGRNLTVEGTTWDFGNYLTQGIVTSLSDSTNGFGGTGQVQVEATATALPGLVVGWSVLGSILTGTQKTNITSAVNAQISVISSLNWNAFAICNRQALTALWNLDGSHTNGRWDSTVAGTPWADSDSASYLTTLEAGYLGQGSWTDATGHVADIYSNAIAQSLAYVLIVHPAYVSASTLQDRVEQADRSYRQVTNPDGLLCIHGRSAFSDLYLDQPHLSTLTAGLGGRYDLAREVAGRSIWTWLRNAYQYGADFAHDQLARNGAAQNDSNTNNAVTNGKNICTLGILATTASLYSSAPAAYQGTTAGAAVWSGPSVGIVFGGGANDPQIQAHGISYDIGTSLASKYAAHLVVDHFGQNCGLLTNTFMPSRNSGFFYYTDSSLSSGNIVSLQAASSAQVIHAGRGCFVYRTGTPQENSATIFGDNATGCTVTDLYYLNGHHAVVATKAALAADGRTMSTFGYGSPPIPLASGDSLNNTATTTTYAYAEAPAAYPETLSVIVTGITSNLQGSGFPRTGTNFFGAAAKANRFNFAGLGVDVTNTSATPSGTVYCAADFAFSHAAMTAATEAAYVANYNRSSDVVTYDYDSNGVVALEKVYVAFTAQSLSGQAIGNYSVTGSAVKAFAGKNSAPDWWGGSAISSVSHSSTLQATLGTAGNLSINKLDGTTTRVWADQGDVTLYAACLPLQFNHVYAYDVFDTPVDITSSCTVTSGVSVVIPSAVVTSYKFGVARFDVVRNLGVIPFSTPLGGGYFEFVGGYGV